MVNAIMFITQQSNLYQRQKRTNHIIAKLYITYHYTLPQRIKQRPHSRWSPRWLPRVGPLL